MVERFASALSGGHGYFQVPFDLVLADEVSQTLGAKSFIEDKVFCL
jgi:hypothetical protein